KWWGILPPYAAIFFRRPDRACLVSRRPTIERRWNGPSPPTPPPEGEGRLEIFGKQAGVLHCWPYLPEAGMAPAGLFLAGRMGFPPPLKKTSCRHEKGFSCVADMAPQRQEVVAPANPQDEASPERRAPRRTARTDGGLPFRHRPGRGPKPVPLSRHGLHRCPPRYRPPL